MKVKESDKNLFKKLEKMFGFNKNSDQLFVPKELAEKIVSDVETKHTNKCVKKVKPKIVETNKTQEKSSSIFDLTNISDIDPRLNVKLTKESEEDFASRIFNLFDIAKQYKMESLSIDQLTTAYYNVYSSNKKDTIKTRVQIASKMYYMDYSKQKNSRNANLVKVKSKNGTYTISDYK